MHIDAGIFPIISNQLPEEVFIEKQEASCELFLRKAVATQTKTIVLENQQFCNYRILLMTSGQYVFEYDLLTKKVKSGFRCDFEIKFWIIRAPSVIANTVGKIKGIAFQFPKQKQYQTVSLFLDQQCGQVQMKSLQRFTSILERKYIVQKQFHQKYKAIKRIGKGVTACVYSSLCLIDKSQVAIKSFKKDLYFNQDNGNGKKGFLKEFKILTELNCTYLSKLLGVYESDHSIYIVQQLLDRTLHNYLQKFGFPSTTQSRRLLYQLLIGLRYLHRKNIMHRDIKLENILIRGSGKQNIEPVIVDFGLAQYQNTKEFVYIRCGTPGYVAPEIINLTKDQKTQIKYNKSCDIFSLGVIFYIILIGKTVFQGDDMRQVVERNKQCNIDLQFKIYPLLAPQIKDLLKGMLNIQPQKRYTVDELMNHIFFKQEKIYFTNQIHMIELEECLEQKISEQQIIVTKNQ